MSPKNPDGEERARVRRRGDTSPTELVPNGGVTVLDEVLAALVNRKRRILLYYLQEHETATVEELARQIAARETGVPTDEVPADALERASIELAHTHLPMLAEALFIEFEDRSHTVRYTEPPELLDAAITFMAKLEYSGV